MLGQARGAALPAYGCMPGSALFDSHAVMQADISFYCSPELPSALVKCLLRDFMTLNPLLLCMLT